MNDAGTPARARKPALTRFLASLTLLLCAQTVFAQGAPLLLGNIDFPTSGTPPAQEEFIVGVLALHSFWYEEARDHFSAAQSLDSGFGMAYWGEAMTYDNAFGTIVGGDNERLGTVVVARMDELDARGELRWTDRERGFANAIRQRFRPDLGTTERRSTHAEAMRELAAAYPDDDEAMALAVLSFMALPGFDRQQPTHVVTVASRLEELFERNPEHPGVLHYLIHVYDSATFARLGLRQARIYAGIAPASSHALHMPSHIFIHLGMWDEVVASNHAAYEASVRWQERTERPLSARDYHALDWLLDAYLQTGRQDEAAGLMAELDVIEAEIERRGEEPGGFPMIARQLRSYFENPGLRPTGHGH